jgi:hypothetical protein
MVTPIVESALLVLNFSVEFTLAVFVGMYAYMFENVPASRTGVSMFASVELEAMSAPVNGI